MGSEMCIRDRLTPNGFGPLRCFAQDVSTVRVRVAGRQSSAPNASVGPMVIDVTDLTFEDEVIKRSMSTSVVVDLWAPWCGPCKTLNPILEKVINETGGQVVLAKVNVDENPGVSQAFQVQSIPAVYALHKGQMVANFMGAQPEAQIREFVGQLSAASGAAPGGSEVDGLLAKGDEESLRKALELEPENKGALLMFCLLYTSPSPRDS